LVADMSTILYSTDTKPAGKVNQVEWQDQNCGCILSDFSCRCGAAVGYQIMDRCRCCNEMEDASGRHDWFLFAQHVVAEPLRTPFGDLVAWRPSSRTSVGAAVRAQSIESAREVFGHSPRRARRSPHFLEQEDTRLSVRQGFDHWLHEKEQELRDREEAVLAEEARLFERDFELCARERLLRDMATAQEEAEKGLRSREAEDAARQAISRELASAEAQRLVDRARAEAAIEVRQAREEAEANCAQRIREAQRQFEERLQQAVEAERKKHHTAAVVEQEETTALAALRKEVQALQIAQKRAEADAEAAKVEARALRKTSQGGGGSCPSARAEVELPHLAHQQFPHQLAHPSAAAPPPPPVPAPTQQPVPHACLQEPAGFQPAAQAGAMDGATMERLAAAQRLSEKSRALDQREVTLNARMAAMQAQSANPLWAKKHENRDAFTRGRSPSPTFTSGVDAARAPHSYGAIPANLTSAAFQPSFAGPRYISPGLDGSGVPDFYRMDVDYDSTWLGCARRKGGA